VSEIEETPPFTDRVERLLNERYGQVETSEMTDYILDSARLDEARRLEHFVWAFRVSETLKDQGPDVGIGRVDGPDPPRLAECLKPSRFSKWGLPEMLAAAEMNDLLIAYGYDLGIGAEAEGAAALRVDEMDETAAWETVAGLCGANTVTLTSWFDMASELLPFVHDMATRNIERVARHLGLRVTRRFPDTAALLVNVGLLLRATQQDTGPQLRDRIPRERLDVVRGCWPSHMAWGGTS